MKLNNYQAPQDELRVSLSMSYRDDDLSGETSSTASAHKGIKPKELNARFVVRYTDTDTLTNFLRIAESTDDNGDLVVYDIVERTANAVNIRQVIFAGNLDVSEISGQQAWMVHFRLREHLSVAEKTEQRKEITTVDAEAGATSFEAVANYAEQQLS